MESVDRARLLVVDDEEPVARAVGAMLTRGGHDVQVVHTAEGALELLKARPFETVISDVGLPGRDGLEFLREVRDHDADLPVILMTGDPGLDSAVRAVEYGAFHYLVKPFTQDELKDVVRRAVRLRKLALVKRQALGLSAPGQDGAEGWASLDERFSSGLSRLWMAFQPIIGWQSKSTIGFEALLRSDEPTMRNPGHILEAGERLGRLHELGRIIRENVAAAEGKPDTVKFFVNLHSQDLNDDELYSADAPLSKLAHRTVLEITERASLESVKDVSGHVAALKALGFQIAIDDLGAGYAGLTSFTQLEPEIAKLDMSLVRGIDTDPRRRSIVRSMKKLCDDLGITVVTEGVETEAERDTLVDLGCDIFQGYLFAKPGRGFPSWS